MRKAKNFSNRLMAMLLSMAMIFSPIFESVPVYAAGAGAELEGIGTLPEETFNENVGQTGTEDANDAQLFSAMDAALYATASDFSSVGGWNESIYAEIAGVKDADVTAVSYSGTMNGSLTGDDLTYLVRDNGSSGVRIDIPGLKKGTYELKVTVGGNTLTKSGIEVYEYDRSGYAHFNYTRGVGAYNDDGTLKDKAVVLYVTDANKNDVTLTAGGVTVKGIGNILNSVGKDTGGGKTSNGGKPNTNQGVIQKLAAEGKPLVVRFVGTVSESGVRKKGSYTASDAGLIDGLTDYDSTGNGGSVGDNGHMARIQSGKDITLEGIGYDATIDGWGFHFISEGAYPNLGESFEVRNLIFINTPEDAVGMEGQQESANANSKLTSKVERCWIHNNEFYSPDISGPAESDKSEGDGSVDFKRGQYFTCSYNYFEGCHKTNLVGSADTSLQFNLSYHHNYWYLCKARGPLTRRANVHMYNNIFEMQTDYAQNTRADAYIFSEYNLFYACKSPQAVEGGAIKSYHDSISSVIQNKGTLGTVVTDKATIVPNNCKFAAEGINYDKFDTDSKLSYIPSKNYKLTEDFTELRKLITVQTGVMDENPRKPEVVNESEYSVISRLGDAVTEVDLNGVQTVNLDPSEKGYKGGKLNKTGYAFSVNGEFNIKITYSSASKLPGVLVNAAGENLLYGSGEAVKLPAGTYMIQSEGLQPGDPKKLTPATFKETTIESIEITPFDSSKHYHKWEKNASKSEAPTCTKAGKNVYDCVADGCTQGENTKEEVVPALGHNYVWKTDKAATADETGLKHEECTRCGDKKSEGTVIPVGGGSGGTGTGGDTGIVTDAGDYVITFPKKKPSQDGNFFTLTNPAYKNSGTATVNGEEYNGSLAFSSKPQVSFSCNDGATLFMVFDSGSASKKVEIDGEDHTIGSDGIIRIEGLAAGKHVIARGAKNSETLLVYMSVTNAAPKYIYYNISFVYNDDDGRDDVTVQLVEGASYATMEALVPASFQKNGYILKGLYKDADCSPEQAVEYPYVVTGNANLYADWEKDDRPVVKMYSIVFNSNGGSAVPDVRIAENQIYTITQRPTRDGYAFAGWYDSAEGGNLVEMVDGSKLSGTYTVYAHWNAIETVKHELNASSLDAGDITEKKTINGFTIHALAGGVGTAGNESPKYYMTVKSSKLYTNGLRLENTTIPGNEDGMLKSIEFTAEGSGYLTVEVELSGKSETGKTYELVLAHKDKDGKLIEDSREVICSGDIKDSSKTKTTKEFDVNGAGTYYLYPEGDKGVAYTSLKLTEQVYTVLYQVGTGTVPAGQGSVTAGKGQEIQLPVCTANPGYTFKGWSMDGGKTMLNSSYTVKEDDATEGLITITAIYDAETYTVKFDAAGGKLPEGMAASVTAKAGDRLTLGECTPVTGKKFAGWSVGSSDKVVNGAYYVNAVDANKDNVITLKAVYKDGSGSDPGPGGEDPIDPDEVGLHVRLKNPNATYVYTGSAIKPAIIVTNNGELLTEGVDYTVK
ncbi:MAG: InlB B-repeat-containing protein, partial [Acetatifactor sp.]|nr:InlB B-repeat-containing protein [Acetatifactor sp.]